MKETVIAILVAGALIAGTIYISGRDTSVDKVENIIPAQNVSIVDGRQIVEITAKGGYSPRKSVAKAGMPTILRFNTRGTFDCSTAVRIPSLNIRKSLPPSGVTDIDLGTSSVGLLQGMCGMGMYPFEIYFQN
jgi:plastocyanin domain-containing protein